MSKGFTFFTKQHQVALKIVAYIGVYLAFILFLVSYFFDWQLDVSMLFEIAILFVIGAFFIIRYNINRFIYRRLNDIYDRVSILDVKDIRKRDADTTDIDDLKNEVIKFAETKRLEIENLKAQEEFRREFIGNLAHELKTPLFTVQGYIETLIDGASEDEELLDRYLRRADKGVQRLINITKDLDLITKLETGDMALRKESFSVDEMVQGLTELLEIRAKKRNIKFRIESRVDRPVMVYADKEKISHVLLNLMINSLKYGKQDGETLINFRYSPNDKIFISVNDNGEGIKSIHLNRIFERFYRVDRHRSREVGGSGLGLAIVKHILEAHGEKINVNSVFTEGTTFSFTLPRGKK